MTGVAVVTNSRLSAARAAGGLRRGRWVHREDFNMITGWSGDDHLVTLYGELDLRDAERVRRTLVEISASGSSVVVDLSGLEFIDAKGLSALLVAKREITARGDRMEIRNARGLVRRVFEVTRLTELLG